MHVLLSCLPGHDHQLPGDVLQGAAPEVGRMVGDCRHWSWGHDLELPCAVDEQEHQLEWPLQLLSLLWGCGVPAVPAEQSAQQACHCRCSSVWCCRWCGADGAGGGVHGQEQAGSAGDGGAVTGEKREVKDQEK